MIERGEGRCGEGGGEEGGGGGDVVKGEGRRERRKGRGGTCDVLRERVGMVIE